MKAATNLQLFIHCILYIYIYIYLQVFSNYFLYFLLFHQKKQEILQKMMCFVVYFCKSHRICGGFSEFHAFSCVSIAKRAVFVCISIKTHHFTAFRSVFQRKYIHRNGNGEFQRHFVAEQPTQKQNRGCKTFFSRNIPRHPDNATRLAVWRITLIFHKNFCIIYIQGKGKNKFPEPKIYRKRGLFMHNRQNDFMFEYFIKGLD